MALNSRNIIVGAAAFFIGKSDSNANNYTTPAVPALVANTSAIETLRGTSDFREAGFTMEGVEVSYEPDYGDVEVDQLLDSARIFKQSMRVTVNTTFAEATLENLLVAWGAPSGPGADRVVINAGSLGDEPTERALVFVGPAPRGASNAKQERIYYVTRAIQTESTSFALRRSEATGLPASFRLLPDTAVSGGAYGIIRDRALSAAVAAGAF